MLRELLTEIADFLPWALSAVQVAGVAALFWLRTTFVGSKRFAAYVEETDLRLGKAEEDLKYIELKLHARKTSITLSSCSKTSRANRTPSSSRTGA